MWRKKPTKSDVPAKPPQDQTREALEFCFEDVSSLRMLGSAPLNDLTSGRAPAVASGAGPAARRGAGRRWNVVVLALLVLTLAATIGVTLLGR